jgi:hypothetical protein
MARSITNTALAASAFLALPAAYAQGDDAHVLVREGDVLGNGDTVVECENSYDVFDDGRWAAIVSTDRPGVQIPNGHVLLRSGVPVLATGDVLSNGLPVSIIRHCSIGAADRVTAWVEGFPVGSNDATQVVWFDGSVVLAEGPIAAPGLPGGALIEQILDVSREASRFLVTVDLAGSISADALLQIDVVGGGAPPIVTLLALSGQPYGLPPGTLRTVYWHDLSAVGEVGFMASFDPAPPMSVFTHFAITVGGVDVLVEGAPSPVANTVWRSEVYPNPALATGGHWAASALIENTTTLNRRGVLVKDGAIVLSQGAPIPGSMGSTVGAFEVVPVALADDQGLWAVLPRAGQPGSVLWREGEVLLRTGLSTAGGSLITALDGDRWDLEVSRDGRRALMRARLLGGDSALISVERDLGELIACPVVPNSTGTRGRLAFAGSTYVAANDLVAIATDLPLNSFGYLLDSRTAGFVANPGGSLGNLCLGAPTGRFVDQVLDSGATGTMTTVIDLTALPTPTGPVAAVAGETWRFQLWHRDSGPVGPTSNFTEGRAVTVR